MPWKVTMGSDEIGTYPTREKADEVADEYRGYRNDLKGSQYLSEASARKLPVKVEKV